jgi:hypothetical protein
VTRLSYGLPCSNSGSAISRRCWMLCGHSATTCAGSVTHGNAKRKPPSRFLQINGRKPRPRPSRRGGDGCELQAEPTGKRGGLGMEAETFLGVVLIAAWAAVVLRGIARTAMAARKGHKWERAYLVGLGVGCAFGAAVMLSIKNSLPLDTFSLSFLLAAGAGFAIWAFGRSVPAGKRKPIRSKRQTGEDGLSLRSTE